MENTLILYDNDFIEIKDILETISKVVLNSRLHNINNELDDVDNYSNKIVAISENNFNLYKCLKDYDINFENKKLIITYIGNVNEDVIKSINEIKEITKKSNLYYYFINLDYKRYENTINAGNNINKYIETNKRSKKRTKVVQ